MQRTQRTPTLVAALAIFAGAAVANGKGATTITPGGNEPVAPECQRFTQIPSGTTSDVYYWNQRLSLAGCLRTRPFVAPVMDAAKLPGVVASLEHHVAPAIAIYRDAIARGSVHVQIVAQYDLGATYVDIMVGAREAIAAFREDRTAFGGASYGGGGVSRSLMLDQALEPYLAGDRAAALAAFREADRLADTYPADARADGVVVNAVANARAGINLLQ